MYYWQFPEIVSNLIITCKSTFHDTMRKVVMAHELHYSRQLERLWAVRSFNWSSTCPYPLHCRQSFSSVYMQVYDYRWCITCSRAFNVYHVHSHCGREEESNAAAYACLAVCFLEGQRPWDHFIWKQAELMGVRRLGVTDFHCLIWSNRFAVWNPT
jgi:hypothetical protein